MPQPSTVNKKTARRTGRATVKHPQGMGLRVSGGSSCGFIIFCRREDGSEVGAERRRRHGTGGGALYGLTLLYRDRPPSAHPLVHSLRCHAKLFCKLGLSSDRIYRALHWGVEHGHTKAYASHAVKYPLDTAR
jgi:hypothetical protein